MSPLGIGPPNPLPDKGTSGVSAAHVRDALRSFRKALALEGPARRQDTVTISPEAQAWSAKTDQAKTEGV